MDDEMSLASEEPESSYNFLASSSTTDDDMSPELQRRPFVVAEAAFRAAIRNVRAMVVLLRNAKPFSLTLTDEHIDEISSFLFDEIMQSDVQQRLSSLFTTQSANRITPPAVAQRTTDTGDMPVVIARVLLCLDNFLASHGKSDTILDLIHHRMHAAQLYSAHQALKSVASTSCAELTAWVNSKGFDRLLYGQMGLLRRAERYIASKYDNMPTAGKQGLVELCLTGRCYAEMVDVFGPGILFLLPDDASEKIHKWKEELMEHVYPLMRKYGLGLQEKCDSIEETWAQETNMALDMMRDGREEDAMFAITSAWSA